MPPAPTTAACADTPACFSASATARATEPASAAGSAMRPFDQPAESASPHPTSRRCEFSARPIRQRVRLLPASKPTANVASATTACPHCCDTVIQPQVECLGLSQPAADFLVVTPEILQSREEV